MFDLKVVATPRTVIDFTITLNDVVFDAADLLMTLDAAEGGHVVTNFNRAKFTVLSELGILKDQGCQRWQSGAKLGPNAKKFMQALKDNWAEGYDVEKYY